jgi:carbonic anhydrase
LTGLKEGLDEENLNRIKDHRAADREAVVTNVKKQVGLLMNNTVVKNSVDKQELIVVGAFYEMSSGIVDFYED